MIINNAIISLTKHRRDMGVAAKVSVAQNVPINEKNRLKNTVSFILIFAFWHILPLYNYTGHLATNSVNWQYFTNGMRYWDKFFAVRCGH